MAKKFTEKHFEELDEEYVRLETLNEVERTIEEKIDSAKSVAGLASKNLRDRLSTTNGWLITAWVGIIVLSMCTLIQNSRISNLNKKIEALQEQQDSLQKSVEYLGSTVGGYIYSSSYGNTSLILPKPKKVQVYVKGYWEDTVFETIEQAKTSHPEEKYREVAK